MGLVIIIKNSSISSSCEFCGEIDLALGWALIILPESNYSQLPLDNDFFQVM